MGPAPWGSPGRGWAEGGPPLTPQSAETFTKPRKDQASCLQRWRHKQGHGAVSLAGLSTRREGVVGMKVEAELEQTS